MFLNYRFLQCYNSTRGLFFHQFYWGKSHYRRDNFIFYCFSGKFRGKHAITVGTVPNAGNRSLILTASIIQIGICEHPHRNFTCTYFLGFHSIESDGKSNYIPGLMCSNRKDQPDWTILEVYFCLIIDRILYVFCHVLVYASIRKYCK